MEVQFQYILNISKDYITLIDTEYRYRFVNDSYCKIMHKKADDIIGRTVKEIWNAVRFETAIKPYLDRAFKGEEVHCLERFAFGEQERFMHVIYYPYFDDTKVTHVVVFSHDITKIKDLEDSLINYEFKDPITGLFNRQSLDIVLDMEIKKAKRSQSEGLRAVLFINMKNLNDIREIYGSQISDLLLENTSLKVRELLRTSDYVFHFHGNDLTVVLTNFTNKLDVSKVAEKIYSEITIPYDIKGVQVHLDCAIGVSIFPDDGFDKNEIIQKALSATNEAKRSNLHFMLFNQDLHTKALKRLALESDLYKAFELDELILYYQPIVDAHGKILGAEALIRWFHHDRGLIPPDNFIPIAERSDLIISIGKWVIFSACQFLKKLIKDYDIYISINLTAREFEDTDLIQIIEGALNGGAQIDPRHLKLEITETDSIKNQELTIAIMNNLKEKGLDIFIDDFGTGYSSLNYLKSIPSNLFKIDKSFIDPIADSEDDREFVKGIINIIKSRKKDVLVEGVSSKEQYEILKSMGCNKMQGYYFSRPIPSDKFEKVLKKGYLP